MVRYNSTVDKTGGSSIDKSGSVVVAVPGHGGRELVSGDEVLHAGEQYRVARSDGSNVEIYQLGSTSLIVPIGAVEPVPEVQG